MDEVDADNPSASLIDLICKEQKKYGDKQMVMLTGIQISGHIYPSSPDTLLVFGFGVRSKTKVFKKCENQPNPWYHK